VRWLAATAHRATTPGGLFRLDLNGVDWAILISYFVVVLGIGFAAKRYVKTGLDYFLSGRSLPAWITGLAFIAANLGALEVIGQAANGAQYGVASVHFYWSDCASAGRPTYGLALTALGIFGSTAQKHKAAGININLWTGLALVLVALLMLAWAYTKPLIPDEDEATVRGSGACVRPPSHSRRPSLGPRGSPCLARLHPCVPSEERRAMG
jgi:hypothetical protein